MIKPANPALQNALRIGFGGIICITLAIVWVFVRSDAGMIGPAEVLALAGMLMIMGAAWKAAEATATEER